MACGIKANGKPDLSLLVSDGEASAAAVFTTNVAQAAPILVSREHLQQAHGRATAVVVNSGCANACTGADGMRDAHEMTRLRRRGGPVRRDLGAGGVDRRHRRQAADGQGGGGHPSAAARAVARRRRRCGARAS